MLQQTVLVDLKPIKNARTPNDGDMCYLSVRVRACVWFVFISENIDGMLRLF